MTKPSWYPDWTGQTCVIVAGGPSAAQADLELARGLAKVMVINASFKLAPWADVLYACDDAFWRTYHDEAFAFAGLKVTQDAIAVARYHTGAVSELKRVVCEKVDRLVDKPGTIGWGGNSGFQAINLAVQFGVKKIILVGYDLRIDRGLHWHGKHPQKMNNPIDVNVNRWRRAIDDLAPVLSERGIEVLNTSPVSKLENYERVPLKAALGARAIAKRPEIKQILALSPPLPDPSKLSSFYEVFGFYLQREIRSRGIGLVILPRNTDPDLLPVEAADHVLGFGLRHFDKNFTPEQIKSLKKRTRGAVAQFADGPRERSVADLSFTCKGVIPGRENRSHQPFHVIGWAADPEICIPQQRRPGPLRILVDHHDYDPARAEEDFTNDILKQIAALKKSSLLSRTGFDGVEVEMLTTPKAGAERVPFTEMAKKYGQTHLFVIGHRESVGLSAIEAAMAGCLVVTPKGFIPDELLNTIRRVTFEKKIPWETILTREIDPKASRKRAVLQSWSLVCDRLLDGLRRFRK